METPSGTRPVRPPAAAPHGPDDSPPAVHQGSLRIDLVTAPLVLPEHRPVDEHANLATHALGLCLSLPAAVVLITTAIELRRPIEVAACATYCASLVGLYAASTLSHLFHDLGWRRCFRTVDQAFIYFLIAGSFAPVEAMVLEGWWHLLSAAMWILAIVGAGRVCRVGNLTAAGRFAYLILGWLPAVSVPTLATALPLEILAWIAAGGLCYSIGTVVLAFDRHVRFLHALWHTLVIAGSTCHYIAILLVVLQA